MTEEKTREMVVEDFNGNAPCAYLFSSGAAMYFDSEGKQICELQCYGISGLKKYMQRFPEAEVHWAIWKKSSQKLDKLSIESLVKYLKEDIDIHK